MCYPLPGPRCTPHTRAAVISAQRAFSENPTPETQARLNEAQREYDKSPEGLERNRQLVEYNIRHGIKTRKTLIQLQEDETERHEGIAAMKELGITVKTEDEPTPFDETGRDIRGFDVSGVNSNGDTVAQAEANLLSQNIDEKEYQLLKELGHRNWTAEDRKNLQEYDTAKKKLAVARAETADESSDEREIAVRAQQLEDAKQSLNTMNPSEIRSLVGFNETGKNVEDEDYQVEERGGRVYITGLVEYARGNQGGSFTVDKEIDLDSFAPVRAGGSYESMTNKQRLRAAELMFGTDSDKYRDAVQKLG